MDHVAPVSHRHTPHTAHSFARLDARRDDPHPAPPDPTIFWARARSRAEGTRQAHHRRMPAVVLPPRAPEDPTHTTHTCEVHPTGPRTCTARSHAQQPSRDTPEPMNTAHTLLNEQLMFRCYAAAAGHVGNMLLHATSTGAEILPRQRVATHLDLSLHTSRAVHSASPL